MESVLSQIFSFIPAQLMILAVILYGLGYFIKETEKIKNCYIPFILLPIGIIISMLTLGFTTTSFMQGIVCVMVACCGNEFIKQGSKIAQISKENKK